MIRLRLVIFLLLGTSLFASAQKKYTWLRKNWDNMVSHYNVYYHGEKMLKEVVEDMVPQHKDDFSRPIEVYPYGDDAQASSLKPKMEEVMKKASMVISKRSKSKWVDDCFLLIGKSHFFRGDYFSADEAFQFVNSQYADRPIRFEGKLWILKTLVRQGKVADAEAIYKTFLREEKFPAYLSDEINLVIGDIYTKMSLYSEAEKYLEAGLKGTKDPVIRYRVHFLLAQLYLITKDYDLARNHYRKVVKANSPYEFAFQSNIGIVKANSLSGRSDNRESRRNLKKMLRDDKNIDYYDQLYFELGNLDYADGNLPKAVKNYQMAARKATKNQELKTNAYLTLARIFYEGKNYRMAQKYFDSTALFINERHPDYEKIKLQQSVLSTLIDHLIVIHTQDSLLRLANLPKDQLDDEIRKLAAREREAKKKSDAKKAKDAAPEPGGQPVSIPGAPTPQFAGTDQFIFDNQALLGREYNEFVRRWGNRKLTDNWRIASVKKELTGEPEPQTKDTAQSNPTPGDPGSKSTDTGPEDLKKYYSNIPLTSSDKELANKKILESHIESGKIYYEKLKEFREAISHFEKANSLYPGHAYEAEVLYYMVRCYEGLNDSVSANTIKKKLISKYPSSEFTKVLEPKDPSKPAESTGKNERREVLEAYERMYNAFHGGRYEEVKQIKAEVDKKYAGNAMQAKFDYLYAMAVGKTEGAARYIELLRQIKDNYPGTDIGALATYTLDLLENKNKAIKVDSNSLYSYDGSQTHYFAMVTAEGQSDRYKTAISNFNLKYYSSGEIKTKSYLLGNKDLLGVEIFPNRESAFEYYNSFTNNFWEFMPVMSPDVSYFIISTDNFKTMLREMNETEYIKFFQKVYF